MMTRSTGNNAMFMKTQLQSLAIFFFSVFVSSFSQPALCYAVEIQVAAGNSHALAIKNDGSLWAWGGNGSGQQGAYPLENRLLPHRIGTENSWRTISAGANISCAIKQDGSLYVWGDNSYGQLGAGSLGGSSSNPEKVSGIWKQVSAYDHVAGIRSDGTLWVWGRNDHGQLGNGSTVYASTLKQIGTDNDWAQVAAGATMTVAIKTDGSLWLWGDNQYGQLGDGTTAPSLIPRRVGTDSDWTMVRAGGDYAQAEKADGTRWAWGKNSFGQLGVGYSDMNAAQLASGGNVWADVQNNRVPHRQWTSHSEGWTDLSAGAVHGLGVKNDGTVWYWGSLKYPETSNPDPGSIAGITDAFKVAAGGTFSVIVDNMGFVQTFGANDAGQLGDGTTTSRHFTVSYNGFDLGDSIPPVITSFSLPEYSNNLNVAISSLEASDNSGSIDGYYLSESADTPSLNSAGWYFLDSWGFGRPTSFTFSGVGVKTLYVWARDFDGNISASEAATVRIESSAPTVNATPAGANYLTAQSVSLTCTDAVGTGCASVSYCFGADCTPALTYSPETPVAIPALATTILRYQGTDRAGNISPIAEQRYTIPYDVASSTVPFVVSVKVQGDGRSVLISFNRAMGSSALTAANYTLSGSGKGNLAASPGSVAQVDASTYRLTWTSGKMLAGGDVTVSAQNVLDAGGEALQYFTAASHLGGGVARMPTVSATPAGGTYSGSQSVTLACDDGYGASCSVTYCTGSDCTPDTSYSVPVAVTFDKDHMSDVIIRFRGTDAAGNISDIYQQTYNYGMSINQGAAITIDRSVQLRLTPFSGQCDSIMLFDGVNSNTIGCSIEAGWTLPDVDGTYSIAATYNSHYYRTEWVYPAQPNCNYGEISNCGPDPYPCNSTCGSWPFSHSCYLGNTSFCPYPVDVYTPYQYSSSATIILDRAAPVVTATPAGGFFQTAPQISLTCNDGTSGSGCTSIHYCTGSGCTPDSLYTVPLQLAPETIVRYRATDQAGHVSAISEDLFSLDVTGPIIAFTSPSVSGMRVDTLTTGIAFSVTDGTGSGVACLPNQTCASVQYRLSSQVDGVVKYVGRSSLGGTLVSGVAEDEAWFDAFYDGTAFSMNQIGLDALSMNSYAIEVRASDRLDNQSSQGYSVLKVPQIVPEPTMITLDLSSTSIANAGTVTVSGKLSRFCSASCGAVNLLDRSITVTIRNESDMIVHQQNYLTSDFSGHFTTGALAVFSISGTYTIHATFAGTADLQSSASAVKTLLVGRPAGYAIIVQGRIPSGEGTPEHTKSTRRIYQTLKERNFTDDNIYWFNYGSVIDPKTGQVLSVDDTTPSLTKVGAIISGTAIYSGSDNQTLAQRMSANPAPLYIVMVDHGSQDQFHMSDGNITPSLLDGWLNTLDGNITNSFARTEKKVIIIGACFSGSFTKAPLSRLGRIIIASASSNEVSYRGGYDGQDSVQSGEYFLDELFASFKRLSDIKTAFTEASEKAWFFTRKKWATNSNAPFTNAAQHPVLDDDGDGTGSIILSDGFGDGARSTGIYLGVAPGRVNSLADPADLNKVAPTIYLESGQTTDIPPLWATAANPSQVSTVHVELMRPNDQLTATSGTGQISRPIDPAQSMYPVNNRFEYSGFTFSSYGKYEAYYYAIDRETGAASPSKRSLVYRNMPGNSKPAPPMPLEPLDQNDPANQKIHETSLIVAWSAGSDPDGDPLTYTLELCTDALFTTGCRSYEEIVSTSILVEGLTAGTRYHWRLWSVDPYTRSATASTARSFTPQSPNPVYTLIKGQVINVDNYQTVAGTSLYLSVNGISTELAAVSGQDGSYAFTSVPLNADPYKFTLRAEHNGYTARILPVAATAVNPIRQVIYLSPSPTSVDGTCGSSSGQSFTSAPTTGLCAAGTLSAAPTGPGPWSWACLGSNGGMDATCTAALQDLTVSVTISGSGGGTVNSYPSGIHCSCGTCRALFSYGSAVTLYASAATGTLFSGWSADCKGSGDCTVNIGSAKNVTATFAAALKAKVGSKAFSTLQAAYDDTATTTGSIIKLLEGALANTLIAGKNIAVKLEGGYNAAYSAISSESVIQGPVKVRAGAVRMKGVKVK